MIYVCAWCKAVMRERAGLATHEERQALDAGDWEPEAIPSGAQVSHGLCDKCFGQLYDAGEEEVPDGTL